MWKSTAVYLLPLGLSLAGVPAFAGSAPQPKVVTAGHASSSIKLDGKLEESVWNEEATAVQLVQQSPNPRAPSPYRTSVRTIVQDNRLYFGFECIDPDPAAVAIHTMRRDGDVEGDDTVAVVLDTYGDHRTGYYFRINAAGARVDGLIAGSERPSLDWDGIWDARTGGHRFERVPPSIPAVTVAD